LRGNEHALRFAHTSRPPPAPSQFAPQPIPRGVETAILRAIAKSPDDRFQTAAEMVDALLHLRGERRRRRALPPRPSLARAPSGGTRAPASPPRWDRRSAALALSAAALVVATLALTLTISRWRRELAPSGGGPPAAAERRL